MYNQNFVPWELSALAPGLYTCIKLCNFQMPSNVERVLTICLNGSAPLNKMAAMTIYGKNLGI